MRITIKKILSLATQGATCSLLIIDGSIYILLDCGINHTFDFKSYRQYQNEIKKVQLVVISHSSLQYSGAFSFLVTQFALSPGIFYTTQSIMRYSPLNWHEQVLNFRNPNYSKKIFNSIYSYYEQMHLVKPHQKKMIQLQPNIIINPIQRQDQDQCKMQEQQKSTINTNQFRTNNKNINLCCYLAGGSLGSLLWRINIGLINILYMVQYTNYSQIHLNGLDLEKIRAQPTSILITDSYPVLDDVVLKKENLYEEIYDVIVNFYTTSNIDPHKPRSSTVDNDRKLLITCYPNEVMIEVMLAVKKVITSLQQVSNRQKIVIVHLSSRYIQLVKSQVEYFSDEFKNNVDKLDEFFMHSKTIIYRINITSIHSINGILNQSVQKNVMVYHVGTKLNNQAMNFIHKEGVNNFKNMEIFKQAHLENLNQEGIKEQIKQIEEMQVQEMEKIEDQKRQEQKLRKQIQQQCLQKEDHQKLISKFFSQIGFPHYVFSYKEQDQDFDEYGLRFHRDRGNRPINSTINDYLEQETKTFEEKFKNSKIQVMNIEFKLPECPRKVFNYQNISYLGRQVHKTNYLSSLQIIKILKPSSIVLINLPPKDYERTFDRYKADLSGQNVLPDLSLYNLSHKKICHIQLKNELIEYKVNSIPLLQDKKIQKVKGIVQNMNGLIHIHLQCLQQHEILEFRLELFYYKIKNKFKCHFVGQGVVIEGIKLYRENNQIIIEGNYSEQFFKVRKMLYEFLEIS